MEVAWDDLTEDLLLQGIHRVTEDERQGQTVPDEDCGRGYACGSMQYQTVPAADCGRGYACGSMHLKRFVISLPSLVKEAIRRGKLMRDQPVSPQDLVTYWVEYVVRHKGARHLRSPFLDMPW